MISFVRNQKALATVYQKHRTLLTRKKKLSSRYHVEQLTILESYVRNEQKKQSDVDILVDFNGPVGIEFVDLANYLEDLLNMRVDLVSRKGIKQKYYHAIQDVFDLCLNGKG